MKTGAVLAAVVLIVGLTGCSPRSPYNRDLTGWLDGGPVIIDAQVEGVSGDGHMGKIADVVIVQVLDSSDTYRFDASYPTPNLAAGDHIRIREGAPTNHVSLRNGRFFFLLQIYGTPQDIAAGRDAEGFNAPYFVLGVFDPSWQLIDGQRDLYPQLQEVLALYPPGLDGVRQLVADAHAKYAGQAADSDTTTPGPLGEWRRATATNRPAIPDTQADLDPNLLMTLLHPGMS